MSPKGGLIAERVKIEGIHLRKNVRHHSSENKHKSIDLEGKKNEFQVHKGTLAVRMRVIWRT